eukprot:TRINITY_DN2951_c0_g1_i1.p1 TRINITY_DN2951_c0_g1~~TRINITY_DN2951_c0_g1_i1.p1  ORF type:complete len:201 (-),score=59.16 TRINITY_DN2951_c0_g1_i1:110-673(-)
MAKKTNTSKKVVTTKKSSSIFSRPFDLLIIFIFFIFALIAFTVDFAQAIGSAGGIKRSDFDKFFWPPNFVLDAFEWWCDYADPLLRNNPWWFKAMAGMSPFIYFPFYVVAIYAIINKCNWIRIPSIMWGSCMFYSLYVIVIEEFYGQFKTPEPLIISLAYGPYVIAPLVVLFRFLPAKPFSNKRKNN